jgi:drug/metabolite transporter (DMT)-like permease
VPNLKDYFAPAMVLALVGIIIPFYLTAFGQVHVESGIAGVLTATMPMISAILFAITTKTRVTSIRYLVMGFIGVTQVCFNQGLNYSYFLGIILILGSAFFYALNSVLVGNIKSELIDKRLLACVVLIVAALISLLVSTLFVEQSLSVSREVIEIGAVLGVFCTTIPVVLLFYAINKYGTVKGSMGAYILPIVAVLLGVVFLTEEFQKLQGLGIIVILASVFGYARNK